MIVKIMYLLSTLLIAVSAFKETKKDVTIKLTPGNFDKEVMRSKDIWFIMFSTVDCKHCKAVKGKFKLAASKMSGIVKFGEVNLSEQSNTPLGRRFNIEGIPTINIFEYGLKMKRKSKMYEYTAKREWKTMVEYATNLYEQSAKTRDLVEIHELNKQSKFDRECLDEMYCVMVMLPPIQDSNAVERKAFLATLKQIASKNKQQFQKYTWFWFQSGDQPEFMTHFNPEQYPVAIYSKTDKQITHMKQMYTPENFQAFLDNLFIKGKAEFVQTKYTINFQTVNAWDGKDYWKVVQEREAKKAKRDEEKKAKKEKLNKKLEEKKAKAEAEKAEKDKKKKEREEKRAARRAEAEKVLAEPDDEEKSQEDAKKAKEEKRKAKNKARKQKEREEEEIAIKDLDPESIDIAKLQKRTAEIMQQTDHQIKTYSDKIPNKVKALIEKDLVKLGKIIQTDPHNKIRLLKMVQKLDKDSMKIGEAIYKNVDQTEINKREEESNKMPEDDEVIRVIKEFINKAIDDLKTYADKIEEQLVKEITDIVDVLNKLLVANPVPKDEVEKAIEILRVAQMKIGQSIYKQAEIAEKKKKEQDAKEARGEDLNDIKETKKKIEEEEVFEIDESTINEDDDDDDDDDDEGEDDEEAAGEGANDDDDDEGEEIDDEAEAAPASPKAEKTQEETKEESKEEL